MQLRCWEDSGGIRTEALLPHLLTRAFISSRSPCINIAIDTSHAWLPLACEVHLLDNARRQNVVAFKPSAALVAAPPKAAEPATAAPSIFAFALESEHCMLRLHLLCCVRRASSAGKD